MLPALFLRFYTYSKHLYKCGKFLLLISSGPLTPAVVTLFQVEPPQLSPRGQQLCMFSFPTVISGPYIRKLEKNEGFFYSEVKIKLKGSLDL